MEENKKEYKNNIFKPNKLVAILIYILFLFILSALITFLVARIYSNVTNVDFDQIRASYALKAAEFKNLSNDILVANAITQGYANLIDTISYCRRLRAKASRSTTY